MRSAAPARARRRDEDAFVHGDLRWDNCLALAAPGLARRTRVLLIDWELAGRGDAAADLGAALGEYLRLWVDSIPIVDPSDPGRLAAHARHPLRRLQPAMRALWEAYRRASARPLAAAARRSSSRRCGCSQAAIEHAQGSRAAPTRRR